MRIVVVSGGPYPGATARERENQVSMRRAPFNQPLLRMILGMFVSVRDMNSTPLRPAACQS